MVHATATVSTGIGHNSGHSVGHGINSTAVGSFSQSFVCNLSHTPSPTAPAGLQYLVDVDVSAGTERHLCKTARPLAFACYKHWKGIHIATGHSEISKSHFCKSYAWTVAVGVGHILRQEPPRGQVVIVRVTGWSEVDCGVTASAAVRVPMLWKAVG